MTQVFASLGMSLDGFVAGPNAGPDNPLGDGGHRNHQWQYQVPDSAVDQARAAAGDKDVQVAGGAEIPSSSASTPGCSTSCR